MDSDRRHDTASLRSAASPQSDAASELRSFGVERVVVIRTCDETDALVRLQSGPVLSHVSQVSSLHASLAASGGESQQPGITLVVFHYNDLPAITEVRRLARTADIIPVCFGSDLYSFDYYLDVHDLAEFYVMPSEAHRRTLASHVTRPVFHIDEALDVIGLQPGTGQHLREDGTVSSRRLLWFGYAESFAKSMVTIVPAIQAAKRESLIDDFAVMVGEHRFPNRFDVKTIAFDPDEFWKTAQCFDYCLLSHMPLDLKLNSFIKSPNKAVTALTAGMIPLASRTPAYESLLTRHGLERFLFSTAAELMQIFQRLDPIADRECVLRSGIVDDLRRTRSNHAVAKSFLQSCTEYLRAGRHAGPIAAPLSVKEVQPEFGFVDHLRGLLPSLARAARMRIGQHPH